MARVGALGDQLRGAPFPSWTVSGRLTHPTEQGQGTVSRQPVQVEGIVTARSLLWLQSSDPRRSDQIQKVTAQGRLPMHRTAEFTSPQ